MATETLTFYVIFQANGNTAILYNNTQLSFHDVKLRHKQYNIKNHIHTNEHNLGREEVDIGRNVWEHFVQFLKWHNY